MEPLKRVLLVEDIPATRRAYREFLELNGFQVAEAGNVADALAALDNIAFHVACVDLGMNESDPTDYGGQAVLRALGERFPQTRAIIVSQKSGGRAHDITIRAFQDFHIAKYLRKGQFTVEQFLEVIREEADRARLEIYLHYDSVFEAMLPDSGSEQWLHEALRALGHGIGYVPLKSVIAELAQGLTPVRPHLDPLRRAGIDVAHMQLSFELWSKAVGASRRIVVGTSEAVLPGPALTTARMSGVFGVLVEGRDVARRSYAD